MSVDSILFSDRDSGEIPATHFLRFHGHPPTEVDGTAGLSIEVVENDEDADGAHLNVLHSFHIDADELRVALTLLLGETPIGGTAKVVSAKR